MRTRAALLIAAFAILVVGASAIVTSHFGGHDWPTPPVPDTATRLITPTEAASSLTDESPSGNDGSVQRTAQRGDRRQGTLERRPRSERTRRAAGTPRRTGRRSEARRDAANPGRGAGHSAPASQPTPSPVDETVVPEEAAPVQADPAPVAPVIDAGAGGHSQARPDMAVPVPAPLDEVIVIVPDAGAKPGPGSGKGRDSTASSRLP